MPDFTPTQGRYLAYIHAYTEGFGLPPAESEIAAAIGVSPPSVNQMMKMLERKSSTTNKSLAKPADASHRQYVLPAKLTNRRSGACHAMIRVNPSCLFLITPALCSTDVGGWAALESRTRERVVAGFLSSRCSGFG
jgi:hypothetical protein